MCFIDEHQWAVPANWDGASYPPAGMLCMCGLLQATGDGHWTLAEPTPESLLAEWSGICAVCVKPLDEHENAEPCLQVAY